MALAEDGAAAASHREAHDGALALGTSGAIFLLGLWHEFLEEEVLVGPARHVEVAVPCLISPGSARIGHDDDHGTGLAGLDELVGDGLHLTFVAPSRVVVGEAVEQVDDGIVLRGILVESAGQIDVKLDPLAEHVAMEAVGQDASGMDAKAQQ